MEFIYNLFGWNVDDNTASKNDTQESLSLVEDTFTNSMDKNLYHYLLGWVLARGEYDDDDGCVSIDIDDEDELSLFQKICNIIDNSNSFVYECDISWWWLWSIKSCKFITYESQLCNAFDTTLSENISNDKYFLRGYFEGRNGYINVDNDLIVCSITDVHAKEYFKNIIQKYDCIEHDDNTYSWYDTEALNLLCELYDCIQQNTDDILYLTSNIQKIQQAKRLSSTMISEFTCHKVHANAICPSKEKASDIGFKVPLIECVKEENNVYYFTTGLIICPDYNQYFEVVGHDDLCKSGYIVPSGIHIVHGNNKEVIVPLVNISNVYPTKQNLSVLLIPKQVHLTDMTCI